MLHDLSGVSYQCGKSARASTALNPCADDTDVRCSIESRRRRLRWFVCQSLRDVCRPWVSVLAIGEPTGATLAEALAEALGFARSRGVETRVSTTDSVFADSNIGTMAMTPTTHSVLEAAHRQHNNDGLVVRRVKHVEDGNDGGSLSESGSPHSTSACVR